MHRIIIEIGPVTIYSYGFMVALAFIICSIFMVRDARKAGLDGGDYFDCLLAMLFGGIVGGRALFVALNWDAYTWTVMKMIMVNEGGLAVQGGLLGGIIASSIACKLKGIPYWKAADIAAPYIALGQGIGRIGCFLNGCCYGPVTEGPFGVLFAGQALKRFPSQLVFSLALVLIFLMLLFFRRHKKFNGQVFSVYLVLFGTYRVLFDFLRDDELVMYFGMNLTQFLGAVIAVCGIGLYLLLKKTTSKGAA